jgi:hypothetical protein
VLAQCPPSGDLAPAPVNRLRLRSAGPTVGSR